MLRQSLFSLRDTYCLILQMTIVRRCRFILGRSCSYNGRYIISQAQAIEFIVMECGVGLWYQTIEVAAFAAEID